MKHQYGKLIELGKIKCVELCSLSFQVSKVDGMIGSSVLNFYQKQSKLMGHTALLQAYVPQKHHSYLPAK